ncbi:MAG: hypothetical protein M3O70_05600, partial [Actinomycetota bacterium]|nr:hypothetical protein [Actinomycetota bacterium]
MALSFLCRLIRRVLERVQIQRMDAIAKEEEILVLRHQLAPTPRSQLPRRSSRFPARAGRFGLCLRWWS